MRKTIFSFLFLGFLVVALFASAFSVQANERAGMENHDKTCRSRVNNQLDDYETVTETDSIIWRYVPRERGIDVNLEIDVVCFHLGEPLLIAQYTTIWKCDDVTTFPVKNTHSGLLFKGKSGLDCSGETVLEAIYNIYSTIPAFLGTPNYAVDNFYMSADIDLFTAQNSSMTCAVDSVEAKHPIFKDGLTDYALKRDGNNFQIHLLASPAENNGEPVQYGFASSSDYFDKAEGVFTNFAEGALEHFVMLESEQFKVGAEESIEHGFVLNTDPDVIHIGHDGEGNFFCGYISNFEFDPSFDPLGG